MTEEIIVCYFPDIQAQFRGGHQAMLSFFKTKLHYPKKAKRHKEQGTVFIKFLVQKDGSLNYFSVLNSVSQELDAEAMRAARLMPKWEPAIESGKYIESYMQIPVTFSLSH